MLGRGHGHAFGHVLAAAANLQVFERAAVAEPVEKQSAAAATAAAAGNGALVDREIGGVGVLELRVAVADGVVLVLVVMVVLVVVVVSINAVRVALEQRELQRQVDRPVGEILD